MLSRFHLIPERYGQTDGQTELLYQYRASRTIKTINYDVCCFTDFGIKTGERDDHHSK